MTQRRLKSLASAVAAPLAKRLAIEAAAQIKTGSLKVMFADGEVRSFGRPGDKPCASIRVLNDTFFARLVTGGEIAFGESYMDGLWQTPDLTSVLMLGILNRRHASPLMKRLNDASRFASRRLHLSRRNTHDGSRKNIEAHYDLGNDFYRLFLDETLTYSCALFESPDQSLADAQRNKYRSLCEKARLCAGDSVLEIGSGWGGFSIYAAQNYGCRVTTITISREQHDLASKRVMEAGLSDQIEVRFCDYRDVRGQFDKIVSIEMFEAVGAEYFETFFAKCDAALRPGGLMALQTIAVPDRTFEDLRDGVNWMQKYIFPGGMLPSLAAIERSLNRTSLAIAGVEDIGLNYPPTLRAWRQRFFENLPGVRDLGFDDRFIRMWEYYLCASEAAFSSRSASDLQIVIEKPLPVL
jgi:cyclopropane-fatty-acyl-phospholipid synthase